MVLWPIVGSKHMLRKKKKGGKKAEQTNCPGVSGKSETFWRWWWPTLRHCLLVTVTKQVPAGLRTLFGLLFISDIENYVLFPSCQLTPAGLFGRGEMSLLDDILFFPC